MFRSLARIWLLILMALATRESAMGFALLGPFPPNGAVTTPDGYQQPVISYQLTGDFGAPKNLGEGYRWNTRKLFYAVDTNFFNYFGSNGLAAVDEAFAIINGLTNVSSYSADLSEFPLNSSRVNFRAEALGLLDIKSLLLHTIISQLGLAEPDRWTWALHTRIVGPVPGCPIEMIYDVIKRNFDPVTYEPSSYVNGTLYSYTIVEVCAPGPVLADAFEIPVDPAAETYTAVAAGGPQGFTIPLQGQFYTGLTRDDVGGLRYLWRTNNMNVEGIEPTSLLVDSNNAAVSLLVTSNLAQLPFGLTTNTGAQLLALFPGLQIVSTNTPFPFFTNVVTTNFVAVPTNCLGCPAGSPPVLVLVPVITTNIVQLFKYTYGNVLVLSSNNLSTVVITTTNVTTTIVPGLLQTNVSTQQYPTNIPGGEFILIPANQCGFSIVATQLTSVVLVTNTITTNVAGFTNVGQGVSIATVFTNHTLVISIPACTTNTVALREGIENIRFFRQDFDSLLGQAWTPITNTYTLVAVTNNVQTTQTFFRVVTVPDIVISAADITSQAYVFLESQIFDNRNTGPGLAGPGLIVPPVLIRLNKVGPIFQTPGSFGSFHTFFVPPLFPLPYNEATHALIYTWGSFNGTTNEPIVYPSGSSISNLENNVFLQITVAGPLTSGHTNAAFPEYSVQLPVSGSAPPFTWALASLFPGQPPTALPPGLVLDSGTGRIHGFPSTVGVFDFVVQVADAIGRTSKRTLEIEIDP